MAFIRNTVKTLTKEREELSEKIQNLNAYMNGMFGKSDEEMRLLKEQYECMCAVYSILQDRIELIKNNKQ